MLYLYDLQQRENVYANREIQEVLGYSAADVRAMGAGVLGTLVHPDDLPAVVRHQASLGAAADGEVRTMRYRMRHRDGQYRTLISRDAVFDRDAAGAVRAYVGLAQDVTEQVQAEAALIAQEQRSQAVLDQLPVALWLAELPSGRLIGGNRAVEQLLRHPFRPADNVDGYAAYQGVRPDGRPVEAHEWPLARTVERGEEVRGEEIEMRRGDGSRATLRFSSALIREPGGAAGLAVVVGEDISEQARAQHALAALNATLEARVEEGTRRALALQEQLRTVARRLPVALFALDQRGHFTVAEGRALGALGVSPSALLGQAAEEVFAGRPELLDDVRRALGGQEVHVQRALGERTFELWYAPNYAAHGEPEGALGLGVDVTERARMEAELRRSNTELERFAYVTSHDLQEPIRTVSSFAQLLERRYGEALDERGRQYLSVLHGGAERMKSLVDDLLDYARLRGGDTPLRPLPLAEPLGEALARLAAAREHSGVRLEVGELPSVLGDGPQLAQLWQNLLGNALKFVRPGVTPEVRVAARREGDSWHLTVSDNGIGIEGAYLERVFALFQRLHTRDAYEGTGLGLSICQKIVERHGGRIWAESAPGQGSTFHFTLPAMPAEPRASGDHPAVRPST